MGLGEYLYLYTLIYESWLGKPVDDGPPFVLVGGEARPNDWSSPDVRQQRGDEIRTRLNRTVLPMLRNQLESLADAQTPVNDAWAESLRTEILLLEEDPLRLRTGSRWKPATAHSAIRSSSQSCRTDRSTFPMTAGTRSFTTRNGWEEGRAQSSFPFGFLGHRIGRTPRASIFLT